MICWEWKASAPFPAPFICVCRLTAPLLLRSLHKRALKKLESLRKSAIAAYSVERNKTQTPRHVLRSMSKENKKPPLAVNNQSSVIGTRRKSGARRVKRGKVECFVDQIVAREKEERQALGDA
ncbi:hypothetical protein SCA6_005734 [Theobroma cacao]